MRDKHTVIFTDNRSQGRFVERRLGNRIVVYDSRSGDTHWIDELSTQVLDKINKAQAITFSDLLQQLNEIYTDAPDELSSPLASSLDSLIKIDLVKTIHC